MSGYLKSRDTFFCHLTTAMWEVNIEDEITEENITEVTQIWERRERKHVLCVRAKCVCKERLKEN